MGLGRRNLMIAQYGIGKALFAMNFIGPIRSFVTATHCNGFLHILRSMI